MPRAAPLAAMERADPGEVRLKCHRAMFGSVMDNSAIPAKFFDSGFMHVFSGEAEKVYPISIYVVN
eukprot:1005668-Rhodomonas_salina.1